jgi:hypothetical protein
MDRDVLLSSVRTLVAVCGVGVVVSIACTVTVKTPEPVHVPTM